MANKSVCVTARRFECVCAHLQPACSLIFNLSPINLAELISRCAQPVPTTHTLLPATQGTVKHEIVSHATIHLAS